ncbi:MAG: LacI family transcriptional regulator [Chitinophagaceae bacterium]|nr:LacI family transcriptional regulator [Chitinophagaceae bacterium]
MKKGITLKDLASRLNMSVSTVSKSLSNDSAISALTKERVKKLADEWNYIPNESARHFKLNKSFTIGLILPDLLDPFFVLAINGVEDIAVEKDYNMTLTQSHEDVKKEEKIANLMISNRVDGVIVAVTKGTVDMSLFQKFKRVGIPVVCIARGVSDATFSYVSANNVDGAAKATEFLIKRGHKRIAHISGPKTLHISQARYQGYENALKKAKFPPTRNW